MEFELCDSLCCEQPGKPTLFGNHLHLRGGWPTLGPSPDQPALLGHGLRGPVSEAVTTQHFPPRPRSGFERYKGLASVLPASSPSHFCRPFLQDPGLIHQFRKPVPASHVSWGPFISHKRLNFYSFIYNCCEMLLGEKKKKLFTYR